VKIPTIPPALVEWLEARYPEVTPGNDWDGSFIWHATRRGFVLELKALMVAQQRRGQGPDFDETPAS
jgi:hypothetical protein